MRIGKIKGIAVAVVATLLLMGAATSASAKPMKPAAIKQFAFVRAASYNDKNDMRPTRLSLTRNKLDIEGRCDPEHPYNPTLRVWIDLPKKTVSIACTGWKVVDHHTDTSLGAYRTAITRIGNNVAANAGVAVSSHGEPTLLWATNRKAVLKFALPKEGSAVEPVKSIVFRNQGKPKIRTYPKHALSPVASASARRTTPFNLDEHSSLGNDSEGVSQTTQPEAQISRPAVPGALGRLRYSSALLELGSGDRLRRHQPDGRS